MNENRTSPSYELSDAQVSTALSHLREILIFHAEQRSSHFKRCARERILSRSEPERGSDLLKFSSYVKKYPVNCLTVPGNWLFWSM